MTCRFLRSQWWPEKRILDYQRQHLGETLAHAARSVPYYADLIDSHPADDPFRRLAGLPRLTKADVQANASRLSAPAAPGVRVFESRTSGTSGEPTTTLFDEASWLACKYALKARRVLTESRTIPGRVLIVSERSETPGAQRATMSRSRRRIGVSRLFLEDAIDNNVHVLANVRPQVLYGQPAYLERLALECIASGIGVPAVPLVFTSSELLTDTRRRQLASLYRGRVCDVYGSTEFKEIAWQCSAGRYHVNFESVYVESAVDAESGASHLLVTSLLNRAMPLIRYDLGDLGSVGIDRCQCGRAGPYVADLQGRRAELLRFGCGTIVAPFVLTTLLGSFREIKSYSIRHVAPDELRVSVFANPSLDAARTQQLERALLRTVPGQVSVRIERLDEPLPPDQQVAVSIEFESSAGT